ncbi:MAG TPA: quinone-dependent dihydroorotate dehydrogenase [Stellaceae bacterium]|nr:quinone-dependent dihydroorotate dehydrogenase [Stellaceae bacterium]
MSLLASIALPLIRKFPPERAHRLTIAALKAGLAPFPTPADDKILSTRLWGRDFRNPFGLAAGFDKNAEVPNEMLRWGFGFVEIGTVTPRPQPGNPPPRVFRLEEDRAVINRLGFNSEGLDAVRRRLVLRRKSGIIGANVGMNRDSSDAAADYTQGIAALGAYADYLVINISSPNTPGLRDLQRPEKARSLIEAAIAARAALTPHRPLLMVKIAPDLTPFEVAELAQVALDTGIDGIIVSNTTVARPVSLKSEHKNEEGGLSGPPLFEPSTRLLAEIYRLTSARIPLIGVGGIATGEDAYAKIRAGASLVQLYTALIYGGPDRIGGIKKELVACLRRDGYEAVGQAVGVDTRR